MSVGKIFESAVDQTTQIPAMPPPKRKSVSYANTCAVVLIPSRKEYIEAGIDLWYNRKDQQAAQSQVANELKQLITYNPALTIETAMKFLYQPQVHLDSTMFEIGCATTEPLNMMLIDRHEVSAREANQSITQILQNYNKWNLSAKHSSSAESAVKHFVSPTGHVSVLDVVLIDESVFDQCHMQSTLSSIVNVFRSAYGFSVLIGMSLSNTNDSQEIRECAVRLGVDFVWSKPLHLYVDMLPLMLASRTKQKINHERIRSHKSSSCLLDSAEKCEPPAASPVSTVFNMQSPPVHHHKRHQSEPLPQSPLVM